MTIEEGKDFKKNRIFINMENSLTTILSVIIGSAITFLATYILENRRIKNEKYKFTIEKTISVGEDFYRFSAYTLLRFETLLDNLQTSGQYNSQNARNILAKVDENLVQMLTKIADNNITITTADIFFGVSGVEKATSLLNDLKSAQARYVEKIDNFHDEVDIKNAFILIIDIVKDYIQIIKADRQKIKDKITELLNIKTRNKE